MKIIRYTGSKHKSAGLIVDLIPKDIQVYLEVFCGSAAIGSCLYEYFEATGKPHPTYVFNDHYKPLIDLFRLLAGPKTGVQKLIDWRNRLTPEKDHVPEILAEAEQQKKILRQTGSPESFWFLNRLAYGGFVLPDERQDVCSITRQAILSRPGLTRCKPTDLWRAREQLKNVNFSSQDYKSFLDGYFDTCGIGKGFLYFDPPYYGLNVLYPGGGWTQDQHREFWNVLQQIKHTCRFLVSYGPLPYSLSDFENMGFRVLSHQLKYTNIQTKKREDSTEFLIMNY